MDDKISNFQEVSVILALLKHADSKGDVDFKEIDVGLDLSKIFSKWGQVLPFAL